MSHIELMAAADALVAGQRLKGVRLEPAGGPADGRDAVELTKSQWAGVRRLAAARGVPIAEGEFALGREEAARLAHALRMAGTPDAVVRRVLLVLDKSNGMLVTGAGA